MAKPAAERTPTGWRKLYVLMLANLANLQLQRSCETIGPQPFGPKVTVSIARTVRGAIGERGRTARPK